MKNLTLLFSIIVLACAPCFAQTSAFNYQGRLASSGVPANGDHQFEFKLFDAATGTNQIGATQTAVATVQNGSFSTRLDFGATAFAAGQDRWLEISVRLNGSSDPFTVLNPRQQVNSVPFAVRSLKATTADNADNATNATTAISAATAGNVTGIVGVSNGGTGSATQNFIDLTSNQTIGGSKTFVGRLSGDGSGLTKIAGTLKWNVITGNQQAESNNGYVVTSNGEVRLNLPAAPQVGDIVRVACAASGGFRITQNDGQTITIGNADLHNLPWMPREFQRQWTSVASSADGTKLVAVATRVYTSTDAGETWVSHGSAHGWISVASSADGTKLVAVEGGGKIYTSTDSGETWFPRDFDRNWRSVASSADGTNLVAVEGGGKIYTSTDSGETWMPRENNRNWESVASSADGTRLVAVVHGGQIHTSTDSGETWMPRENNRNWEAVASSADGTRLVAVVSHHHPSTPGQIYTSTDAGQSWVARENNRLWRSVASSADGTKLVAAGNGTQIYTSLDSGVTWIPQETGRPWTSVASSADGNRLVAVAGSDRIFLRPLTTSTQGLVGGISGGNTDSLELIYVGAGKFLILSQKGSIVSY